MFDHTNLRIWQRAHALSLAIDAVLKGRARLGPPGLTAQISGAAAAIPANIAEGAGQATPPQTTRFLDVSIGSSSELENHLARAGDNGLLPKTRAEEFAREVRELRRMMIGFRRWVLRDQK